MGVMNFLESFLPSHALMNSSVRIDPIQKSEF